MSVKSKMTAIADKIRSLLGISEKMGLDNMSENLNVCQSQVNEQGELLSYALSAIRDKAAGETIVISPVLQDKTIMPTEEVQNVTPDDGYNGLNSVRVEAISKNYIGSGTPSLYANTYTPGNQDQVIEAGQYILGAQTILGDDNLVAENVRSGVSIFGVEGAYTAPPGLPNGISELSSGTFKLSSDSVSHTISHNLGSSPNFVFVSATGDIVDSSFPNYVFYHSMLYKTATMYGINTEIQVYSISGHSDGAGFNTHFSYVSPADSYLNSSKFILEPSNDATKFKAGVTYRWVCGVADI